MKSAIAAFAVGIGWLAASCPAQAVYKCEVAGKVTYQQTPCVAPPPLAARPGAATPNAPLIGAWKSDHALTMDWLRKHTTMTPKQAEFLDQLEGHMTLTFSRERIKTEMPAIDVTIAGKTRHMDGFKDDAPYAVVAAGPQRVSVSSMSHATGESSIDEMHFDGPDTMWMPMGGHGTLLDPQSREYFRRVK